MRTNTAQVFVGSVILVLCCSQITVAQVGGNRIERPLNNPTISPYVNMLRGPGGPGLNYFGLVRPQIEFAQQNQQLEQQFNQAFQTPQAMPMRPNGFNGYSQLGATGHPVAFNSFTNTGFGGGYAGGGGAMMGGGAAFGGFAAPGLGGNFGAQQGLNGGLNGQGGAGGLTPGYGGVTGQMPQFGGIGNTFRGGVQGR